MNFYRETKDLRSYKDTKIGRIPKEWEVVRLGQIMLLKNGERPLTTEGGIFPVYGANGIMGYTQNFLVNNDFTIIIGRVGASGEIHLGKGKIWISDNAIYSEKYEREKIYIPFIYQLLKFKKISRFASKSTHPIITQSFLNSLLIPLPPLPEQKKIAEILLTVDEAIEKVDEAIAKTERLKKGLMLNLLKGIGYKENWKIVRLEEVVEIYDNERVPLNETQRLEMKGKYPYCGANGILDYINDYIFEGEFILLAEDGGYWSKFQQSAYIMSGKFWANNHVHVLKAIDNIASNQFLMYILNYLDLTPYVVGSTRGKLNQKDMRNIKIPLPPLEEQQKIAEILSTVDKRLELLKRKKEKLERVKEGLMNDLLTGRKRVRSEA